MAGTSAEPRTATRLPWIVAAAAGFVTVLLLVLLFVLILPDKDDDVSSAPRVFTSAEQGAIRAASVEAVNILSYSRKNFDADFERALAGATGSLRSDLQGQKADTLKTLNTEKIDLTAQASDAALKATTDKGVVVLVVVTGSTRNDAGQVSPAKVERIEMTLVKQGGKWLASDIQVTEGI
jgi:hypothetical protein